MRKIAAFCVLALIAAVAAVAATTEPPDVLPSVQHLAEQLSHPSLYSSPVDAAPTDRKQTMRRVIASLPEQELHSLGLEVRPDGSLDISDEQLEQLWEERQRQLREVFENVVKPKEHFETVVGQLKAQHAEELVHTLQELEGVLTDMDMATDFHTLGHWPVLTSFLSEQHPPPVRAAAAWAVGTAVKNSYDRQLWLLEEEASALDSLMQMLGNACAGQEHFEAAKKAMYAVGAGSRGNTEVQAALRQRQLPQRLERVFDACASAAEPDQAPLAAKMWHYVSDLVDERWYVQHTLLAEGSELSAESRQQLQQLVLLGDDFVRPQWLQRAVGALRQLADLEANENLAAAPRREAAHALLHVVGAVLQLQPSLHHNSAAVVAHLTTEWDDELAVVKRVCSLLA